MPLYIELGVKKKRKHYINLNQYRNWHHQVKNNVKKAYKEIAAPKLEGLQFEKVRMNFTLWKKDRRRGDRSNVLSVHEKFFCDAFVELGCLVDDSDEYLESSFYCTGGIDRDNPRVDIEIIEVS